MVDHFELVSFASRGLTASLGAPLAIVLGYGANVGFVAGLALTFIPPLLLSFIARDFNHDSEYDPNLASRLLEKHDLVTGIGCVAALFTIPLLPVALLLGLDGRGAAIFVLTASAVCCVVLAAALRFTLGGHTKRN